MRRSAAAPRRRPGTAMFLLILLGLTLGALGHVAVQAQKNEIAAQLGREQAIYEELLSQRRHQQIEIGKLRNPGRLVELARGRLGMTPQPAGFRVLSPPPAALRRTVGKAAP
jgi:cell division protein FtsL